MSQESFSDPMTARVLNEHFCCIKVDREERPDLDKVYLSAMQLLTQHGGGWPLNLFLDPQTQLPFLRAPTSLWTPKTASRALQTC